MSSLPFYLLACLMSVAIVSSRKMSIPSVVKHPDRQCLLRNYQWACRYFHEPYSIDCQSLKCAGTTHGEGLMYREASIGRASRGSHCGERKICYDGNCIDLPGGFDMPREVFRNDSVFYCWRSNTVVPR